MPQQFKKCPHLASQLEPILVPSHGPDKEELAESPGNDKVFK